MGDTGDLDTDATTRQLATFAASLRYADLTTDVVHEATRRIVDTLGCSFGGFESPPAGIARGLAADSPSENGASVLGLAHRAALEPAAFANGVMCRYQDFSDFNKSLLAGGHPSDMIPALLAVADARHLPGKQAILGVIAAYQGFAALPVHLMRRGWDRGILAAVGVAMGAGAMLELTKTELCHAIAIAVVANVPLGVTRTGELSMWKSCAGAAAAQGALFATTLAAKGLTGPSKPFEGRQGLWEQATDQFEVQVDAERYGYRVVQSDIKRFPSSGSTQAVLSTFLEMAAGLGADDVDTIDVKTHWDTWFASSSSAESWDPKSRETADHSLRYLMATALRDQDITLGSFTDEAIRDPSLRPLMNRIQVSEDPELTAMRPAATLSDIEITTKSGQRIVARTGIPRGDHRNPMTDAEVEQKFRGMAGPLVSSDHCDRLLGELWDLPQAPDAGVVMKSWASSIERAT